LKNGRYPRKTAKDVYNVNENCFPHPRRHRWKTKRKPHAHKHLQVVVIHIDRSNPQADKLLNSRPCNDCIDWMRAMGVHSVWYSNGRGELVQERVDRMAKLHESRGKRIEQQMKKTCGF